MQTKEDIEKWERGLEAVKIIIAQEGWCAGVACGSCPFYIKNNGHNLTCGDLGISENYESLLSTSRKCLEGDITFVEGKLVEVVD